jgi:hypothetical protein
VLGALFLRLVIDAVSKLIKASADVYEGMIVGIIVALAVTFTQVGRRGPAGRSFFAGLRGLAAIPTIALFAARPILTPVPANRLPAPPAALADISLFLSLSLGIIITSS